MTDFEANAAESHWMMVPGPNFLGDVDRPKIYLQDVLGTSPAGQSVTPDMKVPAQGYMNISDAGSELTKKSIVWPQAALEDGTVAPFLAAGGAAFILMPAYDKTIGIGAALATGYFVGGLAYYIQFFSRRVVVAPDPAIRVSAMKQGAPNAAGFIQTPRPPATVSGLQAEAGQIGQ